jgi:ethanolamine utilization protein EutA
MTDNLNKKTEPSDVKNSIKLNAPPNSNAKSPKKQMDLEVKKQDLISIIYKVLEEKFPDELASIMELFIQEYEKLIKKYEAEDVSELLKYYRITTQYQPALASILNYKGKIDGFDEIIERIESIHDGTLSQDRPPTEEELKKKQLVLKFKYFCSVCNQEFDIPQEKLKEIEETPDSIVLPKHHDKEMTLKIVRPGMKPPRPPPIKPSSKFSTHTKSEEKKFLPTDNSEINSLKVLSVGIDVGSSTSHLIFSRLTLGRELSYFNKTNRFKILNREIIYESDIIFTPLLDSTTIDTEKLLEFFEKEYEKAKITPEMVDTGAVIVTGETAKKDNASEIASRLSSKSGKFVSASAGPNFESMLGIMGGGMVEKSKKLQQTIMNVDIGGGTSNVAIASNGTVLSTSCINVGGRLLGIDQDFKIWRIDEPTEWVMESLGINYKIGEIIPESDVINIAHTYATALLESMKAPASSTIAKKLMMTDNIEIIQSIDTYSFTGGVAELMYLDYDTLDENDIRKKINPYDDIGKYLAIEIKKHLEKQQLPTIEPDTKIRATVIGAGAFSLTISGSTCYWDESINLPINNIPIVPIDLDYTKFFFEGYQEYMKQKIDHALKNFNLSEGTDIFALYLKERINQAALVQVAKSIEYSLPNTIVNNQFVLIVLGEDGGKMLGLTIKRETSIKKNVMCLDELDLETGDWIDIGAPLNSGIKKAFPITKKSLIFYNK